jgi:hypothetical protein
MLYYMLEACAAVKELSLSLATVWLMSKLHSSALSTLRRLLYMELLLQFRPGMPNKLLNSDFHMVFNLYSTCYSFNVSSTFM